MSDLIFAFPSKGRIRQEAHQFFDSNFRDKFLSPDQSRILRMRSTAIPNMIVVFLPAAEVAHQLRQGDVHIGLTGEDLVRETSPTWEKTISPITRLPFARARLAVAVPQSWIDVNHMEDLDDAAINFRQKHKRRMRFATKYPHLTRAFFSRHGLIDYRLIESLGATEAAPINHVAEAITDLVSTGATLKANGLKQIEDGSIIESQAALFVSRRAAWDDAMRQTAQLLFKEIKLDPNLLQANLLQANLPQG